MAQPEVAAKLLLVHQNWRCRGEGVAWLMLGGIQTHASLLQVIKPNSWMGNSYEFPESFLPVFNSSQLMVACFVLFGEWESLRLWHARSFVHRVTKLPSHLSRSFNISATASSARFSLLQPRYLVITSTEERQILYTQHEYTVIIHDRKYQEKENVNRSDTTNGTNYIIFYNSKDF